MPITVNSASLSIVSKILNTSEGLTSREKCPYSEFFSSVFSLIQTEYGEIQSIFPYSVRLRENTEQRNSEYRHFSRSLIYESKFISMKNIFSVSLLERTFPDSFTAIPKKIEANCY